MKTRIFKKNDGGVIYSQPSKKYQGGYFVDDLTKPIYAEVEDIEKPIMVEIHDFTKPILSDEDDSDKPIVEQVNDETKPLLNLQGKIVAYEKKSVVVGFEKKISGYEIKLEPSGEYHKKTAIIGYAQKELTFDDCKFPTHTYGLEYIDVDESLLPPSNSEDGNHHEMIHFDGDCHIDNLKQDKEWTKVLMPAFLVKEKHVKNLESEIDAELEKEDPDAILVMKKKRQYEKAKLLHHEDNAKEIYEIALSNLSRATKDVSVVKAKIEAKIAELGGTVSTDQVPVKSKKKVKS